jgi:hypothetical protein
MQMASCQEKIRKKEIEAVRDSKPLEVAWETFFTF